jgi:hypothetical protein
MYRDFAGTDACLMPKRLLHWGFFGPRSRSRLLLSSFAESHSFIMRTLCKALRDTYRYVQLNFLADAIFKTFILTTF